MGSAVVFAYLPNPYRYFEYLFLGLIALAAFGMGWLSRLFSNHWRPLILLLFLSLVLVGVRYDYWPKYGLALRHYGRTQWPENPYGSSRRIVRGYQASKKAGQLDRDYGKFRGYLWSRQKKVWDIYVQQFKQ